MSTTDPLIGETIDGYRVERMIGRGSMGMVYYGSDIDSKVPVAIKTMTRDNAEDEELLLRFDREARVAGSVRHPNVAHVFSAGKFNDVPYLIMEYIDGPTFDELVKKGGLPDPLAATKYVLQSAHGLKAASDKGSVHRDIKPANIMLTQKGQVKIVDFGIARNHSGDSLRTAVGVVLGSPYYMSPEQSAAKPLDHRSDIYSLGGTFYYLLTGRPPYEGRNLVEIIQKRSKNDLRPIAQLNPNVPKSVCNIVYKMMRNEIGERYQTYDDLIADLTAVIQGKQPVAAEEVPKSAPRPAAQPQPASRPQPAAQAPRQGGYQQPYETFNPAPQDKGSFLDSDKMIWVMIGVAALFIVGAIVLLMKS